MNAASPATTPRRITPLLTPAIALTAAGAIVGALWMQADPSGPGRWLHWFCKPLATVLVILLAARVTTPLSPRYRRRILAGLGFALCGDVLLMLPADLFVPGLAMFLLGHLCFIAAWLADSRFGVRPLGLVACWLAAIALLTALWSGLAPALRIPVVTYALTLATMTGQAIGRAWHHAAARDALAVPARRAALGAVLFMASDSLIAIDRFHAALPFESLWILGSYYPAIWLIARSVSYQGEAVETIRT
ncbi:lysoplasmalogenase [Dyella sp.]|jgi:uncharacterized membrane protein YhhN|uniref:lysoplasmalogenase n=1 Tax=Dyella sp. TaxID=1869338 RepID=UPI002D786F55|nr:lysoplasmalogenase [Dyella sp.]HET6431571.1 lysoplasmalogenase [Dyella sp.]